MKQLAALALLGTGCLIGVLPSLATKRPAKRVIEVFEATASGIGILRFEIEEFSTDQDIQELAQAYGKGGEDAVESASGKIEKGHWLMRNQAYPITVVRSTTEGGIRTINIVAVAADRVVGDLGGQTFIGHRGYPFAFFHLRIDQEGKGNGQEVPFAAVVFNKQGAIDVSPMAVGSGANVAIPLANVHAVNR
jgi:hypothetical protein